MSDPMDDEDTIHKATERGDLEAIRRFVEVKGVHVDSRDEHGNTPLIVAVQRSALPVLPVIRYLLSKNADVEATVESIWNIMWHKCTSLMIASKRGDVQVVRLLLERGRANVNSVRPGSGCTALTMATCSHLGLWVVPTLLQYGANVNPLLSSGRKSPLLNACELPAAARVVKQLLECGANVNAKGGRGETVLHVAARYSDEETIRLLIAHGATVNPRASYLDETPLLIAAKEGRVRVLRALLENGAKVDWMFGYGSTILHKGIRVVETFGILLDHCRSSMTEEEFGKFLMHADDMGQIALHCSGTLNVTKLLVEQPRRQGNKLLLPACHAQLTWPNKQGSTARDVTALRRRTWCTECDSEYLDTFQSLVLSVPVGGRIAVKLNPALSEFQQSVAEEAIKLIMETTELPDSIAYAILGYVSPLDVMKRSYGSPA